MSRNDARRLGAPAPEILPDGGHIPHTARVTEREECQDPHCSTCREERGWSVLVLHDYELATAAPRVREFLGGDWAGQ